MPHDIAKEIEKDCAAADCPNERLVMPDPASKMAFEVLYDDKSGIEKAVRLDIFQEMAEIEFEAINKVSFAITDLDWLIGCLHRIKAEIRSR